jgi:RNA 2',3'-cyclic 3'-phosphodiesterase
MSDRWRCFVAVAIDEELRDDLKRAVDAWRALPELSGLRWADPAAWHLTLAFLGWTDPAQVRSLSTTLLMVTARHEPMHLVTGGLGAFPSRARARVAWYGVADPERRLAALAAELGPALGLDVVPFRPHVTLARARHAPIDLTRWLARAEAPSGALDVSRLELMRSHLGRGPARYETLDTVSLGGTIRG